MTKKLIVKNKKNVKSKDKQFLYNLLLFALPSNIIDIIIDFSSFVCDHRKCKSLYIFNGLKCEQCDLQYCCESCLNPSICDKCKEKVCTQLCYIRCCVCGHYYCHECMPKKWDGYELYHYCEVCYEKEQNLLFGWQQNQEINEI